MITSEKVTDTQTPHGGTNDKGDATGVTSPLIILIGQWLTHVKAIFVWRYACYFFEYPCKVMRIFEPEFIRDFAHVKLVFGNQFFCAVYNIELYVFLCGLSEFLLYKVSEIVW